MNKNLSIIKIFLRISFEDKFKKTWAGVVWVLINPIVTYLIHCFLLVSILQIKMPNIPFFLLGGVLPWAFFSQSMESAADQLIKSREILFSFKISPLIIILIPILEHFAIFLISFILLFSILSFLYHFDLPNFFLLIYSIFNFTT
jgi:ABC-type polysaccharide/polyol phosphate export permease